MPDTGAPWNIPYVAGTDLVSDWPTDSQTLAEAIADGLDAVVNVVQAVKTDTFSTSSSSYVDVTDLSVSITPSSATSKVLLIAHVAGSTAANPGAFAFRFTGGNSEDYVGDTASNRTSAFGGVRSNDTNFGVGRVNFPVTAVYLDSPATAAAVTYKVQMLSTSGTVYLNRSALDSDDSGHLRVASSLTAIEVRA